MAGGAVIEVTGLRKVYGGRPAVDGLNLSIPAGGVFGFLGPNGSGKTTTIRCLLGLVRPTAGAVRVLGAPVPAALHTVIGRVGSIVETPALFPGFSGRTNLELLAAPAGIGPGRVAEVLEQVGLAARAGDRVKGYSLGMRQRLGLAAALLKDPEVLVLDEPANGLDPAGIKEFRDLLRGLGAQGRTVFVSSHQLAEVQLMCDRVAIVARGRLVTEGTVADIVAQGGHRGVVVGIDRPDDAVRALTAAGVRAAVVDGQVRADVAPERAADVTRVLAAAGLYLHELRPAAVDLETVFLELTGEPREPGPPR